MADLKVEQRHRDAADRYESWRSVEDLATAFARFEAEHLPRPTTQAEQLVEALVQIAEQTDTECDFDAFDARQIARQALAPYRSEGG